MEIEVGFTRRVALGSMVAAAVTAGCRRKEKGFSSMVNMADPSTATQLVSGFHAVENGAWRWTMQKFSVVLKPPPGSDQNGATLRFRMYISDSQIEHLGPMTLACDVGGHPLDPQTYAKAGDQMYSRPVPADVLRNPTVKVSFSLDKARQGDAVDNRQLGVVALLIGLQPR